MFRKAFYELYVSHFKQDYSRMSEAELARQREWARHKYLPLLEGLQPQSPILEIGCGPGYLLDFLKLSGFQNIEGIDISAQQIALAKARGHHVAVADVFAHLEGKQGAYDAIIAIDLFEHFRQDELLRLVPAIERALKPNGILLLQTPNGQGLFAPRIIYGDFTHLTIMTPNSMRQLLSLFAFSNFRFAESGPVPVGLKGRLRVMAWKCIRATLNLISQVECGQPGELWTMNMICAARKTAPEAGAGAR